MTYWQVGAVHPECTTGCADPLIGTSWLYQKDYIGVVQHVTGREQMVFLSHKQHLLGNDFDNYYNFDVSAGEDIEVFIVDTGAQIDHAVSLYTLIQLTLA
jgi:hypothetical protein